MNQIELLANAADSVIPETLDVVPPCAPVACLVVTAEAGWAAFQAAKVAFQATREADYAMVGQIGRHGQAHSVYSVPSLAGFSSADLSSDALLAVRAGAGSSAW